MPVGSGSPASAWFPKCCLPARRSSSCTRGSGASACGASSRKPCAGRWAVRGSSSTGWGTASSDPLPAPRDVRYLHEEAHARLPAVLAAQGLERPVLIGHSDGGSIALLHAAAFPQGAAALVAIAAHVHVEAAALAGIRQAVERWRVGGLRSRLERWHGEKAEMLFHAWAGTWLAPEFRAWDIAPDLAGLQCPALVLQGAADEYATTGHLDAVRAACGPVAEARLLPGLGHSPHLEAPGQVVEAIRAFLAGRGGEGLSRGSAVREQ